MKSTQKNGITLIALVVTIIVLIILAAVSMTILLGENGIITRAQEAARKTKLASIKESIGLKIMGGEEYTIQDLNEENVKYIVLTDEIVEIYDELISFIDPYKEYIYGDQNDWSYNIKDSTTCRIYDYKKKNENTDIVIPDVIIDNGKKYIVIAIFNPFSGDRLAESNITSVVINNTVKEIESCAFYQCTNLKTVIISDSVIKIAEAAFAYNRNLVKVNIPSELATIEKEAFCECIKIEEIVFPEEITKIGEKAFLGCVGLKSITIPGTIEAIGKEAFAYCGDIAGDNYIGLEGSLTSVTIEPGVKRIEEGAFRGLGKANIDLTIPSSVEEIGEHAFDNFGRRGFATIYLKKEIQVEASTAFQSCYNVVREYL